MKHKAMLAAAASTAKRADSEVEATIEGVYMRQAERMLSLFRDLVAEHDTSRHEIKLLAGMGVAGVWVDGVTWCEFGRTMPLYSWRPSMPVVAVISWIDDNLDWNWAAYLDGAVLNPKPQGATP